MNRSFYNGIAGTKTYQYGLDTLADNIANVETTGFKGKSTEFSTIFSQTLSESAQLPTSNQVGLGSRVSATPTDMSAGSLVTTDRLFDFAIAGDGWFAVQAPNETYYTRNGVFNTDAENYLVDMNGNPLLGVTSNAFAPDPANPGSYIAQPVDEIPLQADPATDRILLPSEATLPAKPTTQVTFQGNLNPTVEEDVVLKNLPEDSFTLTVDTATQTATLQGQVIPNEEILDPKPGDEIFVTLTNAEGKKVEVATTLDENLRWQITEADIAALDPAQNGPITAAAEIKTRQQVPNTAHFQAPIIAGNGEKAFVDMQFQQKIPAPTVGSEWDAEIRILQFYETYNPETDYDPDLYYVDEQNNKVYTILDTQQGTLTFDERGALTSNTIPPLDNVGTPLDLNLGTPYDPQVPNSGYDGLTTFANQPTSAKAESHDGYEAGTLQGYIAADDGTIYANFSNSRTTAVAKIPIYHFINDQGLSSEGSVYFKPTANSGQPYLYTDASGQVIETSQLRSYTLESSNVSLNTALTEMIVMQKAFDANAKSITTSDQMIQKAINMKK